MDQVPKTEKAQNEADTSNLDVFSGHSSPSPHQRPSHSGADHHQHGVSRHHGRTHHHEFQGFPDSAVSHDPTALAPTSSRGTVLSRPSHGEGFFDDKHPHGSRRHHGRPHHSAARRHSRSSQLGGLHHEGEPGFIRELFHDRKAYDHGGPRQDDACSSPSKQHLLQAHNHRRFLHHGETYSHHSSEGSCPHSITHSHHREHHHSARRHNYPHGDHRYGEHHHARAYGPHRSRSTARVGAADSHSATRPPAGPQLQSKAANLTHSRSASHARVFKGTKKVHPLDPASKSSEKLAKDEQLQKHKTSRIPRVHKKLHSVELFVWLWEKLSLLFHGFRKMLSDLTESLVFEAFIFFIVCLNTIMLVAQTFAEVEIRGEWYFVAFDSIFLCIYMVEAMLKIIAMGLSYFSDSWNNLDFFIMVMTVLDFMLMQFGSRSSKRTVYNQSVMRIFKVFKSLRALRATRVLRRLRFLTSLQEVTGTLVRSLPSITAILVLMFTCLLLFSVVLRALFHQSDPKRFQNIFTTIFTLFTLLTLDDWSLIYLDSRAQGAWYIVPILMIYIIIQYFIFLNLVIAVLVDNFQMALLKGLEKRAIQMDEKLLDQTLMELRKADPEEAVSEHTKQKRLIEKKFGTMTEKQRELLFHFLQLAAGVEHYQQKFRSQASVIDEIVDTTFETGEEDFRK